jgi:hypothetical protein
VIERVGALDPHFHSFYEELDLCRRARRAGYRVGVLTTSFVEHAGGSTPEASGYRAFYMARNRCLYVLSDLDIPVGRALTLLARWAWSGFRMSDTHRARRVAGLLSVAASARWIREARARQRNLVPEGRP